MACMMRKTIIEPRFHERPAKIDPMIKTEKPMIYIFFLPIVSPSFPQIGTKIALAMIYAVMIHAADETVMPKSLMILGMARFTTVWSNRPRNVPMMTVRRIIHLRLPLPDMVSMIQGLEVGLFRADPNACRHAVFQFRIFRGVEADFDIEYLLLALIRNSEDYITGAGFRADFIHYAAVLL